MGMAHCCRQRFLHNEIGSCSIANARFWSVSNKPSADTRTFTLREANTGRTLVGRFPSRPLPMPVRKPSPTSTHEQHPRSAYQEIADLLAMALLRLRAGGAANARETNGLRLGFGGQQRVNANPSRQEGTH